ncbi:uncharacterized protein LOC131641616 [Vicia villosa]|uniref:uncharacterized protein LOC131641616 n=1 Tax=Vicia villosa TaxID=3911 RepID=UPI00273C939C|nr:uncharacterized protein LOC131641616 [Vicia villosa]
MSLWLYDFLRLHFHLTTQWPLLIYAVTWVTALTMTVTVASFSSEVAFVFAISPSNKCNGNEIRVPLDVPGDTFCIPAQLFVKSKIDLIVPPVFAALIVVSSACVVRAVGLWEDG